MDLMTDLFMDGGNFIVDGSGDLSMVSDRASLLQDLKNELTSFDGDLFDALEGEYGYGLQEFINLEATDINQLELEQRIITKLNKNEYINKDEISVKIVKWDYHGITLSAQIQFLDEGERLQIMIEKGLVTIEEV